MYNKQTGTRIMALLACLFFLVVSSLSVSIAAEEIGHIEHECIGNDCTVCAQFHAAGNFLKQLAASAAVFTALSAGLFFIWILYLNITSHIVLWNPISLKVRMNH